MEYIKYLGIFNLLFVILLLKVLTIRDKNFSLKKHTFSCLGNNPVYGMYFNLGLCIFSAIQTLFSIVISTRMPYFGNITIILFTSGGLILCLAGIFTNGKYPKLHDTLVVISISIVILGVLLLIYNVVTVNFTAGIALIFSTLLIPYSAFLRSKMSGGLWELILGLGISLWNIIFTYLLLFYY